MCPRNHNELLRIFWNTLKAHFFYCLRPFPSNSTMPQSKSLKLTARITLEEKHQNLKASLEEWSATRSATNPISINQLALKHNVAHSTLQGMINGRPTKLESCAKRGLLTAEEEEVLVRYSTCLRQHSRAFLTQGNDSCYMCLRLSSSKPLSGPLKSTKTGPTTSCTGIVITLQGIGQPP